ncbi:hypothetical protein K450DRAFT_269720 [Umbelopsis ramanniana AG]|uniref:Uncharacterized protein n=1 Tax=Umbelopsis ramanniana AG TaxID=1314678 RepID=A0AAD5EEG1_UMBRA|nr:uncharacterized protein K450DRAFT_269720 [Umbelopsis ramanniana AG]KAI8581932.1 hypothetical protein K450DRAFT_269720 [Umbelopsis ramanniana AG]
MSTVDRADTNNASMSDIDVFGEDILRAIHHRMDGRTASDAQKLLNDLIEMLSAEHNELNDIPKRQTLVMNDDAPQSSVPPTRPSTLNAPSITSTFIPSSATPIPSAEQSAVKIVADALGPTSSMENPLIVTQTIYVTATPSSITSSTTTASPATADDESKSMAELLKKYNNGAHNYSLTIIILLCIFGAILVIGLLIAVLWWRKDRQRRKQRAIEREREMEEQSRKPPGGYAYEQFMANKHGLNARQPQDYFTEAGYHTDATSPPNHSTQPLGAPSQYENAIKFKGKAANLPAINTGSAQVEDPPISPTFVPLPGTPMKLVSRQQVFQDPQRRRGVDALDLDAQQESNQKHWKSVHSDGGPSSVTNSRPAGQASSDNEAQKLIYESSDDSDNTISPSQSVNSLNANINTQKISSKAGSDHRTQRGDGHQEISDVAAARRVLMSVDM